METKDLTDKIYYVDIGLEDNSDVAQWRIPGQKTFPVDILTARNTAKEDVFTHTETKERKTAYIRQGEFVFTISATYEIQFQLLEAIVELIRDFYFEHFGNLSRLLITQGAAKGIVNIVPEMFMKAQTEGVKWIKTYCKACKRDMDICVKRSLIDNARRYPVSLVYLHEGHGILVYIDAHFKIRGSELAEITR